MKCRRCKYKRARVGLLFCGPCEQKIGNEAAAPSARPRDEQPRPTRWGSTFEQVTAFTHGGLTFASLNGREVCPDILIAHGSTSPEEAALQLGRLRAREHSATNMGPDLEWDPD